MKFELTVITAEKTIFKGAVKALTAPTVTGEVGILANHQAMIAKLDVGGLRLTNEEGDEQIIFVAGGFLEVNHNQVTVLADTAEQLELIELDQAKLAREKAQAELVGNKSSDAVVMERLKEELRVMSIRERLSEIAKYKKKV